LHNATNGIMTIFSVCQSQYCARYWYRLDVCYVRPSVTRWYCV